MISRSKIGLKMFCNQKAVSSKKTGAASFRPDILVYLMFTQEQIKFHDYSKHLLWESKQFR